MRRFALALLILLSACSGGGAAGDDFDLFRRADPYFNQFIESDSELLWRLKPGRYAGTDLFGADASVDEVIVGAMGLRGEDPGEKGAARVLCLGDSVTLGYERDYPALLAEELAVRGADVQVLNAGVPGYSIAQARRRLRQLAPTLKPDVVVVLLGWNDAKDLLRGYTDTQLMDSVLARFLARFRGPWSGAVEGSALSRESGCCRVPPPEFSAELFALIDEIRDDGAQPLLVTYPAVIDTSDALRHYPGELVATRRTRLAAVRQATLDAGVALNVHVVDLAARSESLLRRGYFHDAVRDPIHPSGEGARELARVLAPKLASMLRESR